MKPQGAPRLTRARLATVAALGAVALGAALLLLVLPTLLGLAGGTSPEVASVLATASRPPVRMSVPGTDTPLVGRHFGFERVTVTEDGADGARAVSTLDFEGRFGAIQVSSLGRETTRFRRDGAGWKLQGSLAPTLVAAVGTLAARRRALETGNLVALLGLLRAEDQERAQKDEALRMLLAHPERNGVIQAWYLRLEAGEVTVTEEEGQPVRLHRLRLVPGNAGAGEFVFAGSLL